MTVKPLQYPRDRVDGFVLLERCGIPFVPRFTKEENGNPYHNFRRHWRAWYQLMKRKYGNSFEPCAFSNKEKMILLPPPQQRNRYDSDR